MAIGHRQRLRDQFMNRENENFTDQFLLELLLTYAIPQRDVCPLAERLISEFGSLQAVLDAEPNRLVKQTGIKEYTVVLIKLVDFIARKYSIGGETEPAEKPNRVFQPSLDEMHYPAPVPSSRVADANRSTYAKPTSRRGTMLFSKSMLKEAIEVLPHLPESEDINEIRDYLRKNLPYNGEQTRKTRASDIIRRMFPNGNADNALRNFARLFPERQTLRDICFYRFCQAEPLMQEVFQELILPAMSSGELKRKIISAYLKERYPDAGVINDCSQAIVSAMVAGGLAKSTRDTITFTYRDIQLPSFAFILHSEYPEPGIYDLNEVEEGLSFRMMLWRPDRVLPSIYELRNRGILPKISEIDSVRQFTTRLSLEQLVRLIADEEVF